MADGKIYITISDERGSGNGKGDTPKKEEKKKDLWNDYAKHRLFNFIESSAKTAVSYSMGNIGNFSGDYETQRNINTTLSLAGIGFNIVSATLAGAKYGPVGAGIGATIAVASEMINIGLKEYSGRVENNKTNYEIKRLRQQSGLDNLTNGSR